MQNISLNIQFYANFSINCNSLRNMLQYREFCILIERFYIAWTGCSRFRNLQIKLENH